jgi:hypothetical protein
VHSGESARVQRGFALIALLSLAALIAAFLIASALNFTSAGISNEREDRSMNALRKAKAALIAYAASEQWQAYKGQTTKQPGGLPCPDNTDTGASPGICSAVADRIGRLPWATIGSEDLRDASGERLWYAVSSNFYKNAANIINSDTPGLLAVTGKAPASNVVAVVIAPGEAISGQDRIAQHNNPAAYLEGVTVGSPLPPDSTFDTIALPTATANDRLLVITQADLMAAVEPVVAARIERDIKPYIQDYFTSWSIYPYAAPFAAPDPGRTQDLYRGSSGQTNGLLPLTTDSSFAGWSSISVTQILPQPPAGTGSSTVTAVDCSSSTGSQIVCRIDYSGGSGDRPDIQLQATLLNVARSFLRPAVQGDKSMTDHDGYSIDWSTLGSPPLTPTVSNTLQAGGNATVIFTGRLRSADSTNNRVFITVPAPYNPLTNSADATSGWFIANQWYRQTYYAVAPDLLLGGGANCTLNPPCLTVNKLQPSYTTSNDKRAILVFAGRALNGSARPSANLIDYFENENLTPGDFIYEHRSGVPTTINDRVVVVSP